MDSGRVRSYELDWLRIVAVLVLVFFHTSEIFTDGWFHIKSKETHYFFTIFSGFIYIWHMPLFFFISGASSMLALSFRSAEAYRKERFFRLFIPLVFGILFVIPPQAYFENVQKSGFSGSFFGFYPNFFNGIYPSGNLHWGHLWFLFYLFVISWALSKIYSSLKPERQKKLILQFSKRFNKGAAIFKLVIPIIIVELSLRWIFSGFQTFITDWANVFHFSLLFAFGFFIYSEKSLIECIVRNKTKALFLAFPFSVGFLVMIPLSESSFTAYMADPSFQTLISNPEIILFYVLLMSFKVIAEWCWLLAFVGYARIYLSKKSIFVTKASRFAFPFYVFHQTVLITIGFYVIQQSMSIWIKYLIITLCSIPLIYLSCLLASSNPVTRFMFGIKS